MDRSPKLNLPALCPNSHQCLPYPKNARSKSGSTVAQRWRVARTKPNRNIPPLDAGILEQVALRYVERYATTRAKLTRYLERKLYERGWDGHALPRVEELVTRFAELGYVDDVQFAEMRAASLTRRGYGKRRIDLVLHSAGISAQDAASVSAAVEEQALDAAVAFARRKRIGPFSPETPDEKSRRRAFSAMIRAGHPFDLVQKILAANIDDDFAVF